MSSNWQKIEMNGLITPPAKDDANWALEALINSEELFEIEKKFKK